VGIDLLTEIMEVEELDALPLIAVEEFSSEK